MEKYSHRLITRVDDKEKEMAEELAKGTTISKMLRRLIREAYYARDIPKSAPNEVR